MQRIEIADLLLALFDNDVIGSEDKKVILKSLQVFFKETSMDFIDCLLIAKYIVNGTMIKSFDKKLGNYIKRLSIS